MALDATGPGYGVTVVLVGPAEIVAAVVEDLAAALRGLSG
jgi:hypothetical protein